MAKAADKKPEKKPKGWVWPIPSKRQTQGYGGKHKGRDYGVPTGTKLVAPTKGKVIFAGKNTSGYGNLIEIRTADGKVAYLAHLSKIDVRVGQTVEPGQLIGLTGNTGNSTGPHLHFEVRSGSGTIDPDTFYQDGEPYKVTGRAGAGQAMSKKAAEGETPMETAQAKVSSDIQGTLVGDLLENINWGNVIAAIAGVVLITVGVTGLVAGETVKSAIQPLTEAIKG